MSYPVHILKWLAYFDVFQHPLTSKELAQLCSCDVEVIKEQVEHLEKERRCFIHGDYVSINSDVETLVEQRKFKEDEAGKYFSKLPRYVRLIRKFPFVKGIAISGSLSKNVMYEDGDVDYFIITQENRMWLCRTLLILFKKIVLLNSRKYFCLNYFVDEKNLKIRDKNIFTAVEIAYLLPVYNLELFDDLKKQNNWVSNFIPPVDLDISTIQLEKKKRSSVLEKIFSKNLGEKLDIYFMQLTYKRWQRKFSNFPKVKFDQTMRSERGVSKHHPKDFQNTVLSIYESKLKMLNIQDEVIIQS
ncbi:MAG: nucleotidyltransferase [Fluviicola sp.]|nr:MAG: nucleotidyltransferase [Fluviicola sp.]